MSGLLFAPALPAGLALALVLVLTAAAMASVARDRRAWPRAAFAVAVAIVLAGPSRRVERRAPARDVAVALVDVSASMAANRGAPAARAALAALRRSGNVDWRVLPFGAAPGSTTRIGPALARAAATGRLAGVVVLSDGVVDDPPGPDALPSGAPAHLLLAGDAALADRRVRIVRAPGYVRVGEIARVVIRVDGPGAAPVPLAWEVDGRAQPTLALAPGLDIELGVRVARRGPIEVTVAVPAMAGEATLANNRALARINGVRERLRVLLLSGAPYPGGRAWRDILKADDAVDLVHFTILRLPSSYDPTPSEALALIPLPVDELFGRRLASFDLVVFDRFGLTGLLRPDHLEAVTRYVGAGGALLVVAGDEFAADGGLAATSLARVLPGASSGPPIAGPIVPSLTPRGASHPVTAPLPRPWGAWDGQAAVGARPGALVLLAGAGGRPLLVVGEAGRGRTALLASTGMWWWARNVAGAGPRDALVRRLANWLMREPDLEESRLEARAVGGGVEVAVRGSTQASIVAPDGRRSVVALTAGADGVGRATVAVRSAGLVRVEAGGASRALFVGEAAELARVTPDPGPLGAWARATGGGVFPLASGVAEVRRVGAGDRAAGPDWLGLRRNEGGALIAVETRPLIPAALAWALLGGLLALAWWRERG